MDWLLTGDLAKSQRSSRPIGVDQDVISRQEFTVQDLESHLVLNLLLNSSFQRPGSVRRIVPFLKEQLSSLIGQFDGQFLFRQQSL